MGNIGADVSVMQKGLTASFDAVKAVGVTALVAAGGAVVTDYIFTMLHNSADAIAKDPTKAGKNILGIEIGSTTEQVAKAVMGIAGGICIGRFLKKPQLGAAFAIGAVALAIYNIAKTELKIGATAATAGLGFIQAQRAGFHPGPLALGAQRVERQGSPDARAENGRIWMGLIKDIAKIVIIRKMFF